MVQPVTSLIFSAQTSLWHLYFGISALAFMFFSFVPHFKGSGLTLRSRRDLADKAPQVGLNYLLALIAMYIPKHFAEPRVDVLHQLIRARPLSTLVTLSSSGLNANHIPLHLSLEPSPFGTLRGHVARANPIWNDITSDIEALAIFHGPDAYITPSW